MLEDWNSGRWNAGILGFKAIIPLIQHSIIPMAFSGGVCNGS
jgi:hypothetical protein